MIRKRLRRFAAVADWLSRMTTMRFNKDFIAETLAAYSPGAVEEARRLMGIRGAKTASDLESSQTRNSRKTIGGQVAAVHLRDQHPVTQFVIGLAFLWLIFLFGNPAATLAQPSLQTTESRARSASHSFLPEVAALRPASASVTAVDTIVLTVADADAEVAFFMNVLSFEKVSDVEVAGENYEHLEGLFGLRARIVRMKLGEEYIELTEYLAPRG